MRDRTMSNRRLFAILALSSVVVSPGLAGATERLELLGGEALRDLIVAVSSAPIVVRGAPLLSESIGGVAGYVSKATLTAYVDDRRITGSDGFLSDMERTARGLLAGSGFWGQHSPLLRADRISVEYQTSAGLLSMAQILRGETSPIHSWVRHDIYAETIDAKGAGGEVSEVHEPGERDTVSSREYRQDALVSVSVAGARPDDIVEILGPRSQYLPVPVTGSIDGDATLDGGATRAIAYLVLKQGTRELTRWTKALRGNNNALHGNNKWGPRIYTNTSRFVVTPWRALLTSRRGPTAPKRHHQPIVVPRHND